MILADIATLESISDRLRSAGGFETVKAADDIQAMLNSEGIVTEDAFHRLLHSVRLRVSISLDRENHFPGREVDLEKLEFDLASAIELHRTAACTMTVIGCRGGRSGKNTPEA